MNRFQSLVLQALAHIILRLSDRDDSLKFAHELETAAKWTS